MAIHRKSAKALDLSYLTLPYAYIKHCWKFLAVYPSFSCLW